jgi:hypothetical protein
MPTRMLTLDNDGGAFNQQTDRTAVSLEMRFWRVA